MITTGTQLATFITELNGGASMDATLMDILVSNAKAILEEERPWVVLRKTDKSLSATTAGTWQTAISLADITDFSRLYEDKYPIKIFDGDQRVEYYELVPFNQRLEFKDSSHTAVIDENAKVLYLNGIVPFDGTLWIDYQSTSTEIDIASDSAVWTVFPSRFLPILGYYAIGINKGAIDYDSINRQMLPTNRDTFLALKNAMETWDDRKQSVQIRSYDPTERYTTHRNGSINIHD